jgi:hypothetical protein
VPKNLEFHCRLKLQYILPAGEGVLQVEDLVPRQSWWPFVSLDFVISRFAVEFLSNLHIVSHLSNPFSNDKSDEKRRTAGNGNY